MSFIASTSASGLSNAPSVAVPAGTQVGDDVILICTRDAPGENYATTKPAGFETLDIASLTGDGQQIFVGHKKLTSADVGSYTFGTQPDSWYWVVQAFLFRGRDSSSPVPAGGITVAELNSPAASPVSISASGLNAEEGDDLLYLAAPDTISGTTGTFTPPAGFTERTDAHADQWANLSGATKENVASGSTGDITGVFTASGTSAGYAAYLIRLKAASVSSSDIAGISDAVTSATATLSALPGIPGAVEVICSATAELSALTGIEAIAEVTAIATAEASGLADIAGVAEVIGSATATLAHTSGADISGTAEVLESASGTLTALPGLSGMSEAMMSAIAEAAPLTGISGVCEVAGSVTASLSALPDIAGVSEVEVSTTDGYLKQRKGEIMAITVSETKNFNNGPSQVITVFDALTVAAGATGAWSDNVMPFLVGGEGYVTSQLVITGSGTFSIEAQGSADGATYGDIYDADGVAYGTASSPLSSGLAAANTGRCQALKSPLLGGLKFRIKETGAANSVTVTMYLITKAD